MKLGRIARKTIGALAILLVFGLVKAPLENGMTRRYVESGLIAEVAATELSSAVGQSTMLAVLGGLRPLVAIYTTLHAFDAWSFREWDTVERDYRLITTMMPEDIDSWVTGSWHMAYNASASARYDDPSVPEAVAEKNGRDWMLKGVAFIKKGIQQNPESAKLHEELARIYWKDKLDEPCLAAEEYQESLKLGPTKTFIRRFYGYFLSKCPGHEREAYDYLMDLYREGKKQRLPSLISRIKAMEEALKIPQAERIPDPDPDREIRKEYPNAQLPFD
ncbi:MAG: hypothetical protein KDN19_06335 [Verrucomicrobiae bacterium]|nr:hypothetical protein [Verrucomicrobiae bacterium]